MNNDLKIIKKKYGEEMMHLCRCLFATILDKTSGILPELLQDNFYPSHYLYDDLIQGECVAEFKNYLYSMYDLLKDRQVQIKEKVASPSELLRQVGYTLYECQTEADIQVFKKYYAAREALCTFNGDRLNYCYVYFAVKDGAEKLNRCDFLIPRRQDEYGTSVISIQFTKDSSHTLSIKNRYNHTVPNPDATFSNNLDNIVPGLTQSFSDYYGMTSSQNNRYTFELDGYVQANDLKFYKYNYEINNIYYCPDNIVINNYQVTKYDKEKYLVVDYFILDLVNKKVINFTSDSFPETLGKIKNIQILNQIIGKKIIITPEIGEDIIITIDQFNRIIGLKNNNVLTIPADFLPYNKTLEHISLENVQTIGKYFLSNVKDLTKISLPNVIELENYCLCNAQLTEVSLPRVKKIGGHFLSHNRTLTEINLPNVESIGTDFLREDTILNKVDLPNVLEIGYGFNFWNQSLKSISLPKVKRIDNCFLSNNQVLQTIDLPNVEEIKHNFLFNNEELTEVNFPNLKTIGNGFLINNKNVTIITLPKIETIGQNFLLNNFKVQVFYVPNLHCQILLKKVLKQKKVGDNYESRLKNN